MAGFIRESERGLSGGCDGNRDGIESGNPAGDLRRDSQRDARRETSGISTGIVRGKGAGFQPGSERGFYRERAWGKGATVAGQRAGDPCGGLRGGSSGIVRANTGQCSRTLRGFLARQAVDEQGQVWKHGMSKGLARAPRQDERRTGFVTGQDCGTAILDRCRVGLLKARQRSAWDAVDLSPSCAS